MNERSSTSAVQAILSTADVPPMRTFYTRLFGAQEGLQVPGTDGPFFITLHTGGGSVCLVDDDGGAQTPPGRVTLAVFVDDVDEVLTRVEQAGGKVLGPVKAMPWGHRVAHITDPDGNPINLTQQL